MASRRPMLVWIPMYPYTKECYLEDFEGNYFKTLLPHCVGIGKECVGLTCGYMVFYGEKTRDFWLINPITRNELHFPAFPGSPGKAILVFSPSMPGSGLVLVVLNRSSYRIWFSLEGKGARNHVSSVNHFLDLHAFKGKIYTLNSNGCLYELRFNPKPKLTLLEIKNLGESRIFHREFVSSGENLYVIQYISEDLFQVQELNFGEMKLVSLEENTIGEYAFFLSIWNHHSVAIKPESWAVDPRSDFKSYDCFCDSTDETQKGRFFKTRMWYFPHLCLDVDLVNE
ncbi:unnamed protein product [Lactuca virosa]|uniref:KIB1-4 beta-propeller domain-containing protein n=1 Tax=Lactuca virosa TaxID=75947 RepID=A0AAU9LWG7_9ASTR|nr:unnamed protein product [Lactuca virosa]